MNAGDMCTRDVVTCGLNATILEACKIMRDRHVGDIVAVEKSADGKLHPRGLLTDRDIVLAVLAREVDAFGLFVADVMSSPLIVTYEGEDVWQVVKRMRLHAIRRMPVVGNAGELVGLLSFDDLLDATCVLLAELSLVTARQPHFEEKQRA
ncbi:CBS domain-containing protein [Paraburkholderia xenovorans]|uniref:CBS domain-containing protein n=1 Tax=Paraburkholderia xenovorans TaxID=36873 RepID=UPI001559224F|nr:CBS domain-containing protein [Paraburkholderia xenovorans]NPT34145.1 CBS domain-containing protein [Paraburkholderia xenovorans]